MRADCLPPFGRGGKTSGVLAIDRAVGYDLVRRDVRVEAEDVLLVSLPPVVGRWFGLPLKAFGFLFTAIRQFS